jgi:ankyrin repeat protein
MAEFLLENNADINIKEAAHGNNPLHGAASNGYSNMIRLLKRNGADPNIGNHTLMVPLHMAAQRGHIDAINSLLQPPNEANIEARLWLGLGLGVTYSLS